jgi:hypothetical protein
VKLCGAALIIFGFTLVVWTLINLAFGDPIDQAVRLALAGAIGSTTGFFTGIAWPYRSEAPCS